MIIGAVLEEVSCCFDIVTASTHGRYTVVKVVFELVITLMTQTNPQSCKSFKSFGIIDIESKVWFWSNKFTKDKLPS